MADPSLRVYAPPVTLATVTAGASARVYAAAVTLVDPAPPPTGDAPSPRVYTPVILADPEPEPVNHPPIRVSHNGSPWLPAHKLVSINGSAWQ